MDNKLLIKEFYEEVVSKNLIDKIENYVDINCAARTGENSIPIGLDGMKQHVIDVRKTYPDLRIRIIRQYQENDYVISEIIAEGTHLGEYLGIKPTGKKLVFTGVLKGNGRILDINTVPIAWNGFLEVVHELGVDDRNDDREARLGAALQEMTSGAVGQHEGIGLLERLAEATAVHPSQINTRNRDLFVELQRMSFTDYTELFRISSIRWVQQAAEHNTLDCVNAHNLLVNGPQSLFRLMETIAVWEVGTFLMPGNRPNGFYSVISQDDLHETFLIRGLGKTEAYQLMRSIHKGCGIARFPRELREIASGEQVEWFEKITYLPKRSWLVREALLQLKLAYYRRNFPREWGKFIKNEVC